MSACYDWVDPFAEIALQKRLAQQAYDSGRRAVLDPLQDSMRRGLPQKLDAAAQELAMGVARHMAKEVGAQTSYDYFSARVVPMVAEAFREGCKQVIGAAIDPAKARVRLDIRRFPETDDTCMTIRYETVQPITLAMMARL